MKIEANQSTENQSTERKRRVLAERTRTHVRYRSLPLAALIASCAIVKANEPPPKPSLSAPRSVKEGNLFLKGGNPSAALERYKDAKSLEPNAREIAFDEGLAHYALDEYDKARAAFERAAGGEGDELADDAIYGIGAADHAEALAQGADPTAAMGKLESAMQQYQSVLSRRPDHAAARDANYKAASYWRQLKQFQQQQQQQQTQSGDQQEKDESEQEKQEQSAEQNQEQQEQQQQSESQKHEPSDQQQQQAEQQESQEEQQEESQVAKADEQEDVSREQSERQLREMMQAQRDRKKHRREEAKRVPLQPVEKDW